MAHHDHNYRSLFSHPRMVEDLLRSFVRQDWVEDLDFATLERLNADFINRQRKDSKAEERRSDVIWRVRFRDERWLYVILLVEFQSTVDRFMALRLLVYAGLVYQDLLKRDKLSSDEELPPVLPLVLYNGVRPWKAPRRMRQLFASMPKELVRYQPRLEYLLLDEQRIPADDLETIQNPVSALFRLEQSRDVTEAETVVRALVGWLRAPEQEELRRTFLDWLTDDYLPEHVPGVKIPRIESLEEVSTMLEQNHHDWSRSWVQRGIEKGRKLGVELGRKEGRKKGLLEGRKEGRKEGRLDERRRLVGRQLTKKFGPLDEQTQKRLQQAGGRQLLSWSERLLTADNLEDVFKSS